MASPTKGSPTSLLALPLPHLVVQSRLWPHKAMDETGPLNGRNLAPRREYAGVTLAQGSPDVEGGPELVQGAVGSFQPWDRRAGCGLPIAARESGHPCAPGISRGGSGASCPGIPDRQTLRLHLLWSLRRHHGFQPQYAITCRTSSEVP